MIEFIRENQSSKLFWQVKVWRESRHCNAFYKHTTSIVFETYLGPARALENLERIYMLDSNNKRDELHEVAQLDPYRDSLKYELLVVF